MKINVPNHIPNVSKLIQETQTKNNNIIKKIMTEQDNIQQLIITEMANLKEVSEKFYALLQLQNEVDEEYYLKEREMIDEGIKHLWFINLDLLFELSDKLKQEENSPHQFDENFVQHKIEESLPDMIKDILGNEILYTQRIIIEQSYSAYNSGNYAIALMPIFATFDNLISRWLRDKIEDYKVDTNVYIPNLWRKINDQNGTVKKESSKSVDGLLQYQITSAFIKFFDVNSKYLNRNSILHGSYNYDEIGKKECLKMYALLHAALDLLYIEPLIVNIGNDRKK